MESSAAFRVFLGTFLTCILFIGKTTAPPAVNDPGRPSRALPESDQSLGAAPWHDGAQSQLRRLLARTPNTRVAKNVVLFLGDGMSVATISAARVMHGQRYGLLGEESSLSFEEFPYTGLSKTYCVDKQVADSACTSTAYLSGVKANYGTIGVTGNVPRKDCAASADPDNHVSSIAAWAQKAGKATGIVTTTRITHASPAGAYGHAADRDWEADSDVVKAGADPKVCLDLAQQLVTGDTGRHFKIILGGGRKNFLPNTTVDPDGQPGVRIDGLDLISAWQKDKAARGISSAYVTDKEGLLGASQMADSILGLFHSDHMKYHLEADSTKHPTLAEMTTIAIQMLSKESKGFFLFVEGGRIDHGHHDNLARKALDETIEFSEAIKAAMSILDKDTLVVVTSDHAHTMSYAGYPKRGSDILGLGGVGLDGLPYSTLAYANGPSYKAEQGGRHDLSKDDMRSLNYTFPAPVPLDSETHGGEDVAVFAHGPWSHLFTGLYEQNVIPHTMAYAACIGTGLTACSLN